MWLVDDRYQGCNSSTPASARDVKYDETLFEILAKQNETARLDEAHDATLQILWARWLNPSGRYPRKT